MMSVKMILLLLKNKTWNLAKNARQEQESVVHSPEQVVRDEVEQYCKIIKPDVDSNSLQWWQQHETAYPTLAKLAKSSS